jgi:magnesium transporter
MVENILELINEDSATSTELQKLTAKMNVVDIADAFETLSREKVVHLFNLLPKTMLAEIFSHIEPEKQQIIIEALTDDEVEKIINELFVDDAVDFIEKMPPNVVRRVLYNVSDEKRQIISKLLQYPDDSVGSIMTTEYVYLREDTSVDEAFDFIKRHGVNKETIYTCYVIRRNGTLVGVVSAKTLMLSQPQDLIGDIMDKNIICAQTHDDKEEAVALFNKYGLLVLPVVDEESRLVGIVTVDDIVQIIQEETTEDIEIMAALNPSEKPYLKTGVLQHSRNRIFWLMFLMLSATITGAIISSFEEALLAFPALMMFVPMLMDTGGNAGGQSSALIIRGMALGEIRFGDILKVLWRETRIAALCGFALAAVNFARIYFINGKDFWLCLTVSVSLIATVLIAKTVGCLLPLAAKKVKLDPAIMAAPLITTVADAASLIIYFLMASMLLKI